MTEKKPYLTLSANLLEFLQLPDEEIDKECLLPAFKKSKNEIIERVLSYVDNNNLHHDDNYIYPDKKLKQLLLDTNLKKITQEKLVKLLDIHAIYLEF